MRVNSPHRSSWCRLDQPSFQWRSISQASLRSSPVCSSRHCRSSWRGRSQPHKRSCSRSTCGGDSCSVNAIILKYCKVVSPLSILEEEQGLHAVASCEVSMDEVLAAEVLHPSGNISHKLHQHLRREVLKRIKDTGFELHFLFCPAEGSRAHVSEDGSAELKLGAALQEHLLCFYTSGPFRILQKPCSDSALKMAPSSWQSGKSRTPSNNK